MFEGLPEELGRRDIVLGPHGDLLTFDWHQEFETKKWVLETAVAIIQECEKSPDLIRTIDPLSIVCLCRAVEFLPVSIDYPILVDLALVARTVIAAKEAPASLQFAAEMLWASGRYFDLLAYFENKLAEGDYDRSLAHDLSELIEQFDMLYQHCLDQSGSDSDGIEGQNWRVMSSVVLRNMMKFCRGGLLQIERALRVMSYDDIKDSMDSLTPSIGTIGTRYGEWEGEMNVFDYTDSHSFFAYTFLMMNNLAGLEAPIETILEEADKACMDLKWSEGVVDENDGMLHYKTLFGHVVRLRILSSSMEGEAWGNAVSRALNAIERCKRMRGWDTYESVIASLSETGRIGDMEAYASVLGRSD